MRARDLLMLGMTLALPASVLAQASGEVKVKRASQAAASRLVVMPAGDVKWTDLDPGAPGVKVADLWGNHATCPFCSLFKLPAGFAAHLHTQLYDMTDVLMYVPYTKVPYCKP